uniref:Uncharacterized protein n=1 Tax=Cacopsylla melanoneura TaxID=428564 RepID=A0A8D8QXW0_9HEMI
MHHQILENIFLFNIKKFLSRVELNSPNLVESKCRSLYTTDRGFISYIFSLSLPDFSLFSPFPFRLSLGFPSSSLDISLSFMKILLAQSVSPLFWCIFLFLNY